MQNILNTLTTKERKKKRKKPLEGRSGTYCITEVTRIITIRIKNVFTEARTSLINILITDSMQQEVRIPIFLSITHFVIEALPHLLQAQKLIYFPLQLHPQTCQVKSPKNVSDQALTKSQTNPTLERMLSLIKKNQEI